MNEPASKHLELYTVGHSNHEWPVFAALLKKHSITAIADVRSSPYSRFTPQFNREIMEQSLNEAGVRYVFLGKELGARRDEPGCYEGRQARYEKIARSPLFLEGIDRLLTGAKENRIALVCAEKDPITCHRMVLVCKALRDSGLELLHVLDDGSVETNADAERRMMSLVGVPETDLFQTHDELLEEAYRKQGLRIGWVEPEVDPADGLAPASNEGYEGYLA